MSINLDGLELSEEQIAAINKQNEGHLTQKEHEENVAGLKAKRDDLLASSAAEKQKKAEAEKKAEANQLAALEKSKNFEQLAGNYKSRIEKLEQEKEASAKHAQKLTLKAKASELSKLMADGDNADIMSGIIEKRLKMVDGKTVVTDPDGNITINTTDELVSEFKSNKKYASLVTVTNADGGGGGNDDKETKTETKMTGKGTIDFDAHRKGIEDRLAKKAK